MFLALLGLFISFETERYTKYYHGSSHRGADKFLARSGMKQATVTENFDVHIFYLLS